MERRSKKIAKKKKETRKKLKIQAETATKNQRKPCLTNIGRAISSSLCAMHTVALANGLNSICLPKQLLSCVLQNVAHALSTL
jgi:hypothetical protein